MTRRDFMSTITIEKQLQNMPKQLPVVVLMQRQPSKLNQWSDYQWDAIGVMAHSKEHHQIEGPQLVHDDGEVLQYLYTGFEVRLYIDECESYYYNLISPTPRCYVIARENDEQVPIPFLVSMSFDEAHAYMEMEDTVFVVDVPPELYRWTEDFVLMHYAPEKRKKRKRDDWKNQEDKRLVNER
jgi:hypothetical protein